MLCGRGLPAPALIGQRVRRNPVSIGRPRRALVRARTVPAVTVVCTPQRPLRKPEQTGQRLNSESNFGHCWECSPSGAATARCPPLCPDHSAPRWIRQGCPHHYSAVTRNPRFCSLKSRHQSSLVVDFQCYKRPSHSAVRRKKKSEEVRRGRLNAALSVGDSLS
jgi:hypothetical protein